MSNLGTTRREWSWVVASPFAIWAVGAFVATLLYGGRDARRSGLGEVLHYVWIGEVMSFFVLIALAYIHAKGGHKRLARTCGVFGILALVGAYAGLGWFVVP